MVMKCPSDGCSWTGELRNKEVKNQNINYIQGAMDSVLVNHKSSGPRPFHPPLHSVLRIHVLRFQITESKPFNAVIHAEEL